MTLSQMTPKKRYRVATADGEPVFVNAQDKCEAALKGATKLGMRWAGKRPSTAQPAGFSEAAHLHVVYGPYDPKANGQHRIGQVWIWEVV